MTRQEAGERHHRLGRLEFPVFSSWPPSFWISSIVSRCTFGASPDDYPEPGTEITVIGEFQPYEENGVTWYHLVNAKMV